MTDAWDDEDFDPDKGFAKKVVSDKWDDEDIDDAKDAWDDSDEEDSKAKPQAQAQQNGEIKATQKKKKKPLSKRILEIEAQEHLEKNGEKTLTPEEEAAEKLKRKQQQEEADLQLAKQAFGENNNGASNSVIDSLKPVSKSDFEEFRKLLADKIKESENSPHYANFLEDLFRECSLSLPPDDLKRIGNTLVTIGSEKAKSLKVSTSKTKKKPKATIQKVRDDDYMGDMGGGNDYGEFDDFI